MSVPIDKRKLAIAAVTVAAMVAFLLPPLCDLSGCSMPSGMMHDMHGLGASLECAMTASYTATAAGVVPLRLDFGALVGAMLVAAMIGIGPSVAVRRTALATARSGAPPPGPLGTRLLI